MEDINDSCVSLWLLQWPPKGFNDPYDPVNYDADVVHEYGGYADEMGRFGGGRRGAR